MRLFIFSTFLFATSFSFAALISKGVGVVGDKVVTSREVQISAVVEQAISGEKTFKKIAALDSEEFKSEVSQVLLEWMVFMEAQSFSVGTLSVGEQQQAEKSLDQFISKNKSAKAFWGELEVSSKEKSAILLRKMRANKFIEFKTKSSYVAVSDREALEYFQQKKSRFGDVPFEKFKNSIKTYIAKAQAEERLKEWFKVLQRKYNVKNLVFEK